MKFLTTDLENISWLRHGFFTRLGGVSTGIYTSLNCGMKTDDRPTHVRTNRAKVSEALYLAPEQLVIAKQVHGTTILPVTKPWDNDHAPEADAIVTVEPGIGLGVLTADCAPILLADKKARIIGAAHAGWRGALNGIIESTVEEMQKMGAKTENIAAAIGPCIGPNSYEVRDDFKGPFIARDKTNERFFKKSPKPGHLLFNLPGYVASRLNRQGIKTVHDVQQDTLTNATSFFSNRRAFLKSEHGFGLQLSVISIKSGN
ncbi:MAG: peptidoglycan editing factor PgeF [Proteobacteria bacterium]|nr:peptidoglycan editing factor PgeF [Pseudomonadota bacterium]